MNRATASIKDNYRRKSNEIDLNKEKVLLNAQQQIRSIQDVEKPSLLGTFLGVASAYIGAKEHQEQMDMMRERAYVTTPAQNGLYKSSALDLDQQYSIRNRLLRNHYESTTNPYDGVQQNILGS